MGTDTSYGDRYHWAVHGAAEASLSAASVFLRWFDVGGFLDASESQQIFPSPAAQSFLINGGMHRVFARQGTLVPAAPGWEICGRNPELRTRNGIKPCRFRPLRTQNGAGFRSELLS